MNNMAMDEVSLEEENMVDIDFKQPDNRAIPEERTREGLLLPNTTRFNLLVILYMVLLTITSFALMILVPIVIYSYVEFEIMEGRDKDGLLRFVLLLSAGVVLIAGVNNVIGWVSLMTMQMKFLYLNVALKCITLVTTVLYASLLAQSAVWFCLLIQVPILCIAFGIVYEMRRANREPRFPIESLIATQ